MREIFDSNNETTVRGASYYADTGEQVIRMLIKNDRLDSRLTEDGSRRITKSSLDNYIKTKGQRNPEGGKKAVVTVTPEQFAQIEALGVNIVYAFDLVKQRAEKNAAKNKNGRKSQPAIEVA